MYAILIFLMCLGLGFLFPWPRTLLLALGFPAYYAGLAMGIWGSGLGDQWLSAAAFLTVESVVAIGIGILMGGGYKLLKGEKPPPPSIHG